MWEKIKNNIEDGIFFSLYLAAVTYYFYFFEVDVSFEHVRQLVQKTGTLTKHLSQIQFQLLLSYICVFFVFALGSIGVKLLLDFFRFKKVLVNLFQGEYEEFKNDFLKIVMQQFIYFGSIFLLFIGYLKTVKRMPNPFGYDFYYLAFLVYIAVAGLIHGLRYLPLFFYSIKRKI